MLKWIALLLLGYLLWRALTRPAAARKPRGAGERMVACAECGVYLPESDALPAVGRHFCNRQHCESWQRTH